MRLQFRVQEFQTVAVHAVADCFAGQPYRRPGTRNAPLELDPARLLANVRAVQERAGLPLSATLAGSDAAPDAPNLDIEMEAGTGKTYVYIKTIMELHRRHGWSRFIVVVPGVAIREGVRKAFQVTAEHFRQAYGTCPRPFTYDSSRLHELERFRTGAGIQVMIINLQAFNSATRENRRIYEELDGFASRRPIDVISASRPIVVIDEPQRIGSARSLESLSRFGPLMVLRYSATHRARHDLVHRLDAVDAHRRGLVKRIAVVGVDGEPGPAKRRVQIREVIRAHLDRERELHERGIKVLSLLFIDQVVRYRDYSRPDQLGDYARMFVEEYRAQTAGEPGGPYRRYLDTIPVERTHQGYFAIDRRTGRMVDADASDVDAYHLILRDRERLLSMEEPVRFVFSHSALREGWDNPNVFVIGMLKSSDNTVSRRQEVGRGLRLAVDQRGERVDGVNELTVVADESYSAFVAALQAEGETGEIAEGRRPVRRRPEPRDDPALALVEFDSAALVQRCVTALDAHLTVPATRYTVQTASGERTYDDRPDDRIDLLGEMTARTGLTRRTVCAILAGLRPVTFALYRNDPALFVREATTMINREIAAATASRTPRPRAARPRARDRKNPVPLDLTPGQ
ncbi:DEAD/DEAH box helicase family protein [Actinoplanes sp. NPDC023801]|uniref:DEAD/DEAH box helicase family protein n=1 Tax=Actinoplanes sp. NPDC023801 TaxID=3154595 RepID=UPI0033E089E8